MPGQVKTRAKELDNKFHSTLKISGLLSSPQSLFLCFGSESKIPSFNIPCVKGSLCPDAFVSANQIFPASIVTFPLKIQCQQDTFLLLSVWWSL